MLRFHVILMKRFMSNTACSNIVKNCTNGYKKVLISMYVEIKTEWQKMCKIL